MKRTVVILGLIFAAAAVAQDVQQQPKSAEQQQTDKKEAKKIRKQKLRESRQRFYESCQKLYETPHGDLSDADRERLNFCYDHYWRPNRVAR